MISKYGLKAIGKAFRPYALLYCIAILIMLFASGLLLAPPYLLKILIDRGLVVRNPHVFYEALAAIACVMVGGLVAQVLMDIIHEYVGAHFTRRLREQLFDGLVSLPLQQRIDYTRGDLYSRLINDSSEVYGVIMSVCMGALGELATICGVTIAMIHISVPVSVGVLLSCIPIVLLIGASSSEMKRRSLEVKAKQAVLAEFLLERITSLDLIRMFRRKSHEILNHDAKSRDVIAATLKSVRMRFASNLLLNLIVATAVLGSLYAEGRMVLQGALTVGSLLALYMYAGKLFAPLQSLSGRTFSLYSSLASLQRVGELLTLPDRAVCIKLPQLTAYLEDRGTNAALSCSNVVVAYEGSKTPVLRGFNLDVPRGAKIVVIGSSGCGKTTLLKAISGHIPLAAGSIRINGENLESLAADDRCEMIGFLSQETQLLNLSIRENVLYGRLDATDEEIDHAVRLARLDECIASMPNGYETIIGLQGCRLSGGQRQRLALARLLLKKCDLWLLDEFTSALDDETEAEIFESLRACWADKTVLMVAHRVSTIQRASGVVILDRGVASTVRHPVYEASHMADAALRV